MIYDAFIRWAVPFVCGGLVTVCGAAIAFWKNNHKRNKAVAAGLQCLLRAEIIRSYEKYIDRGYCPIYAREALKREYASYHDLGGNDVATDLYNQVMRLPTEPKKNEGVLENGME